MWITPNPSPAFLITIGIPFSYSIADGIGAWIYQLRGRESVQWPRTRNQLAYLPAGHGARGVFRLGAKPNWLA